MQRMRMCLCEWLCACVGASMHAWVHVGKVFFFFVFFLSNGCKNLLRG